MPTRAKRKVMRTPASERKEEMAKSRLIALRLSEELLNSVLDEKREFSSMSEYIREAVTAKVEADRTDRMRRDAERKELERRASGRA
jgi:Arc/MetJ-type ribon-helix-helix transcriptional regulator